MLLIDRYITRQFLINFVILLFVLIALFVLIDMVINLDEFIDAARHTVQKRQAIAQGVLWTDALYDESKDLPLASLLWSTASLIWDWHGPLSVLLFVYLSGLVAVGAMGFTFSEMIRKGEMVAMLAGGVSMYRITAPLMVTGTLISVASLPIQEWLVPPLAEKLARSHRQLGQAGIHSFKVRFARDGRGHLFSAATFGSIWSPPPAGAGTDISLPLAAPEEDRNRARTRKPDEVCFS